MMILKSWGMPFRKNWWMLSEDDFLSQAEVIVNQDGTYQSFKYIEWNSADVNDIMQIGVMITEEVNIEED